MVFIVEDTPPQTPWQEKSGLLARFFCLREPAAIGHDAGVIQFIYWDVVRNKRPDNPEKGEAEIIVAKQRNELIGPVRAHLDAPWP
jgi:replicative DNA helicase